MIHYSFDTFKDFSEFHSQFAALNGLETLAFDIDNIDLPLDNKFYETTFYGVSADENLNKDNLIDYAKDSSAFGLSCWLANNYDPLLAETKKRVENVDEDFNAEQKQNGFKVFIWIYFVYKGESEQGGRKEPNAENLTVRKIKKSDPNFYNYYAYEIYIDKNEDVDYPYSRNCSFSVDVILNEADEEYADLVVQKLIESAVVLK